VTSTGRAAAGEAPTTASTKNVAIVRRHTMRSSLARWAKSNGRWRVTSARPVVLRTPPRALGAPAEPPSSVGQRGEARAEQKQRAGRGDLGRNAGTPNDDELLEAVGQSAQLEVDRERVESAGAGHAEETLVQARREKRKGKEVRAQVVVEWSERLGAITGLVVPSGVEAHLPGSQHKVRITVAEPRGGTVVERVHSGQSPGGGWIALVDGIADVLTYA